MLWKLPPRIKIYEALGSIGDKRVEAAVSHKKGTVQSSNGTKKYTVLYDPEKNAIMTNDSASYWVGYLGYPGIAFLMEIGKIPYDSTVADILKDIAWKEINLKFKNNYDKTEDYVLERAQNKGFDRECLVAEVDKIYEFLKTMKLEKLGKRILPPKGK